MEVTQANRSEITSGSKYRDILDAFLDSGDAYAVIRLTTDDPSPATVRQGLTYVTTHHREYERVHITRRGETICLTDTGRDDG